MRSPWSLVLVVLLVVAATPVVRAIAGPAWIAPDHMRIYVAVPADATVNYGLADAALHETELALSWLEGQTGRQLRGADIRFAEIVRLAVTRDQLVGDVERAFGLIHAQVLDHAADGELFPVVLADVRTEVASTGWLTCGLGGVDGVVMFLGNCPGDEISTRSTWGSGASTTIAHELVHGLGAVLPCAPHATDDGHVDDDPADILFDARRQRDTSRPVTLDAGRDDYYDHDIPGCPDIADSPLWER